MIFYTFIAISMQTLVNMLTTVVGSHVVMTDYPNVTLSTCGIGRQSLLESGHCLKWSSNVTANIVNGRNAEPGEVPFAVLVLTENRFVLNIIPITNTIKTFIIINIYLLVRD